MLWSLREERKKMLIDFKFRWKDTTYYLRGPHRDNPDDHWCYTYGRISLRYKSTIVSRINKLPHYIHRIKYRLLQLKLWWNKESYKMCQGCGEGFAVWKIVDPNYPGMTKTKKYVNCCDGCVNFYDWHWSQKEIKYWNNGKAYTRKYKS